MSWKLSLSPLFTDGCVLQRGAEITVRGVAAEGPVSLTFLEQRFETRAGASGDWAVTLPPQAAGGPFTLTVAAGGQTLAVCDVYIGDVWLCGGQSNMELPMQRVKNRFPEEMRADANAMIRQFYVPQETDFQGPRSSLSGGEWKGLDPETVKDFTAAGYFFAKKIHAGQSVPVGLLHAAAGGTPVQAWMRRELLEPHPEMLTVADRYRDDPGLPGRIQRADQERMDAFFAALDAADEGLNGRWYSKDFPDETWPEHQLCATWAEEEGLIQPGVAWFRKTVSVPPETRGKPAKLFLGCIVDSDVAYADGERVGTTGYRYPPREYDFTMPDADTVTLAVRVSFHENPGGFIPDKPYNITCGDTVIDLDGLWKFKRGAVCERFEPQTFINRGATGLYNAMIAPLHGFPVKGVLFYQGESNTNSPEGYGELFKAMIADWRARWNQPEMPFLFVQLANYETPDGCAEGWPRIRDEQRAALALPATAMAVSLDAGEENDLHPTDKKTVGERLAMAAERVAYGLDTALCPAPDMTECKGNALVVRFSNAGSGLTARGPLNGFEIAGSDGGWHPAEAMIEGDRVVLSSPAVPAPNAARYAWSDAPKASLYSAERLPCGTFCQLTMDN
jgi:sialate O-acetylesterase